MRLLDRYLLRELLIPLGFCLSGFSIFWVASDLFADLRELQSKKLLAGDILQLYVVRAPEFLVVVLPVALLLALLYTLTNHARHHEITAIRGAGISMWRLAVPYFGVGLACSLAVLALNELWVPNITPVAEAIKARRMPAGTEVIGKNEARALGFDNTRDGRVWQIGIYNFATGEMVNPQVIWTREDGTRLWIKAERAWRTNGVWMFAGLQQFQESKGNDPPLVPVLETNLMAMPEFTETPEQIRSEVRISNSLSLRSARKTDIPITVIVDYLRLHPNPTKADADWLYTKLHGRLAFPWACLVVVVIALPFGAASGRRNVFVGVASSVVICFAYFVLQQVCLAFGTSGALPPWLAGWAPNILFGAAGLYMTAKVR